MYGRKDIKTEKHINGKTSFSRGWLFRFAFDTIVFSWLFIDILEAPGRFSALYVSLQYIFPDIYSGILAGADKLQLHSDGRKDYARHNNSASIRGIIQ